ncbi:hypothetical protein Ancab_012289 [Ancistrocladus abbreviatus]
MTIASFLAKKLDKEVRLWAGVPEEAEQIRAKLQRIQAVLVDAEKKEIVSDSLRVWLDDLKHVAYDIEDVLDDWKMEIVQQNQRRHTDGLEDDSEVKVCASCIPPPHFSLKLGKSRHRIAHEMRKINQRLEQIAKLKDDFGLFISDPADLRLERRITTSFGTYHIVHGQTSVKNKVVHKLLCGDNAKNAIDHFQVLSLVGMGGIGKTTIAKMVYNDDEVRAHFTQRIWICISDMFDELKVAKSIAKSLNPSGPTFDELQNVVEDIQRHVTGRKFLLVLDDVWTEDNRNWDNIFSSLSTCLQGSKVLVTTRSMEVAKNLKAAIIPVKELPEEECWSLFSHFAFTGRDENERQHLEDIGRSIARKCKGLPLAAETLGRAMVVKRTRNEWKNVFDSELWGQEFVRKGLLPPLLLSYIDLPSQIKRCFVYCSIFPKDSRMSKECVIHLWMALGFLSSDSEGSGEMELNGEDFFNNLVARSFFQDLERSWSGTTFQMHDIIHDFALFLAKEEGLIHHADVKECDLQLESGRKIRHLNTIRLQPWVHDLKNLRSLLCKSDCLEHLPRCSHLKALCMASADIWVLTKEIGNLTHLKYINLSNCQHLVALPEVVCELYNLQILDIRFCFRLKSLPEGIGRLVNLRHLLVEGTFLPFLPKGISRLTSLLTLDEYFVANPACEVLTLEDLGSLEQLRELTLHHLNAVAGPEEAKKLGLENKKDLLSLTLQFDYDDARSPMAPVVQLEVLEALRPPEDLECLGISGYKGERFTGWIKCLINLKHIGLSYCTTESLPPLGELPFLKTLYISSMHNVRQVGSEFLGLDKEEEGHEAPEGINGNQRAASSTFVAFPQLKKLRFDSMHSWETWEDPHTQAAGLEDQQFTMNIMPSLCVLKLDSCFRLEALPRFLQTAPIEYLDINRCPRLQRHSKELSSVVLSRASRMRRDFVKEDLSHIPGVDVGGNTMQGSMSSSASGLALSGS